MPAGEFDLIKRHLSALGAVRADVVLGVGDDAALLATAQSPLCSACAHVDLRDLTPGGTVAAVRDAVHQLDEDLRRDGAVPAWATLALTLSKADDDRLSVLADAIHRACEPLNIAIIGGDTTAGADGLTIFLNAQRPAAASK